MTDYFKTIRAYLRGKWGNRGVANVMDVERYFSTLHASAILLAQIETTKRTKKKHSHLQKQLDDLLNGGAQISDQQTENAK